MIHRAFIKRFTFTKMRQHPVVIVALCLVFSTMSGCGKPFNVKARTSMPPVNYAADSKTDGIGIQAQLVTDEDYLYETFDANLISAGVLPVRVRLINSTVRPLDLEKARFELRESNGQRRKALNARAAFKRLICYYEISLYNKAGYKDSLETFSEYAVDMKAPLDPGQSRQGLMFFRASGDVARETGLTLVVRRLDPKGGAPVELKLN